MVKVTVEQDGEIISVTEGESVVLTMAGIEEDDAMMQIFGVDTNSHDALTEHALIIGETIRGVCASDPPEGMAILLDSMDALITGGKVTGEGIKVLVNNQDANGKE